MKEYVDLLHNNYPAVSYIFVFLFGIVVGSFLNVCIYRIPEQQSIVTVPSHCMSCGKKLHWYELIPLFSWIFLRGKCRGCKAKISAQYPLVEAANGLLWCLVLFMKGPTLDFVLICALFSALLVMGFIDARTMEIPNGIVIFILLIAVLRALLHIFIYKEPWLDFVLGSVIMGGVFFLILFISNGRAMGGGDVKLMFAIGLFLGLKLTVFGLVAACVVGSVIHLTLMAVKKVGRQLAFGPYLAIGFAISVLWGNLFINWYMTKFFV
ncbi:MAG: prepilin peptidase [Clostridia bacterium]|nr:prepilin peptidase [Clostridia bacterium]